METIIGLVRVFDKSHGYCQASAMRPLSLVIITKNEAANIGRCLDSVPFAQEKIVLDSGSQDDTVRIAEMHGAKVFQEEWRGFYGQRVRVTELAGNDLILALDADEALSPELAKEIQSLLNKKDLAPAYAMPRLSFHLGRWIHRGGWYPDWQIRLFDRKNAVWSQGEVHEKIAADRIDHLQSHLLHWVFKDVGDQVETNNRYSSLGARDLRRKGVKFSMLRLVFKPFGKFIETYLYKRGFLDGLPGFIISIGAAYSMFLKYAKLWELERLHQDETTGPRP